MSHYSESAPDTEPGREWLEQAICKDDPDLMFPDNNVYGIGQAKEICAACPVRDDCLEDALQTGDNDHGIRGGLTPRERRALAKGSKPKRPKQAPPKTLAEAFTRRAARTEDGHVLWYGAQHMKFQGVKYSALRAAFLLGHGREPVGPVRRTCGRECHRADHLTDGQLRDEGALCGTRAGYRLHKKRGEAACGPCRQANTDADNRLRRTGTTKAAA